MNECITDIWSRGRKTYIKVELEVGVLHLEVVGVIKEKKQIRKASKEHGNEPDFGSVSRK